MKIVRRAYKKTVSIINETAVQIYENYVGDKKGFLLESYDKNNGRYVFIGKEPEAYITSKGNSLIVFYRDGSKKVKEGNPVELLKEFYSQYEIKKDDGELAFTGGLLGALGYDYVRYSEELPDNNDDEIGIETIQLMLVTEFIT